MTLCKYRPRRTYDGQFLLDENDVNGLLKMTADAAAKMREDGVASYPYYVGAYLALSTLLDTPRNDGEMDIWMDFVALFEKALEEFEGQKKGGE